MCVPCALATGSLSSARKKQVFYNDLEDNLFYLSKLYLGFVNSCPWLPLLEAVSGVHVRPLNTFPKDNLLKRLKG